MSLEDEGVGGETELARDRGRVLEEEGGQRLASALEGVVGVEGVCCTGGSRNREVSDCREDGSRVGAFPSA